MIPTILRIPASVIDRTIEALKKDGARGAEGIALWLGQRTSALITIVESYVPIHESESDYFHIPPAGMTALMNRLAETETFVAAQVHSHPFNAFHSRADDSWAIVRHEGAVSIVVPEFASGASVGNFRDIIAVFQLNARDEWEPASASGLEIA